jgi:superfamily II DNA/RNA helicase
VSTCIVTPNNELKSEFRKELAEINCRSRESLPIINIGAFIKKRHDYEFVFVDEAHNLRSAIELDRDIVKSIHLEKGEPLYDDILSSLEKDQGYIARELSAESAHDILRKMMGSEYEKDARSVLRTLSQWRSFCIVCENTCDLKFLAADPDKRNLVPKGRLFLFSATLLDPRELQFYCNIPKEMIETTGESQSDFVPKKNVSYRYILCGSDHEKKDLVISLLKNTKLRTLVLVNSNSMCLKWDEAFSKELKDRVIAIQSRLHFTERFKIYRRFMNHPNPILLTSSSVYWEGMSISNLRLLIIPNPPFPQPSLLEIAEGKHAQYREIAKRRLIQGMGRIGRSAQENGICLILFRPPSLASYIKAITKDKARHLIANSS